MVLSWSRPASRSSWASAHGTHRNDVGDEMNEWGGIWYEMLVV